MVEHDDEIEEHHEREHLVDNIKVVAKKPSCRRMLCKAIVLSTACILFILMMIQLWTDYGSYIETNTFPPKMKTMGTYCKNSTRQQDSYLPVESVSTRQILLCVKWKNRAKHSYKYVHTATFNGRILHCL